MLIEMGRYFVLHAPRQTGKTTVLDTLASELTAEGDIAALTFSCERAKAETTTPPQSRFCWITSAKPPSGRDGRTSCCRRIPGRQSHRAAGSVRR
ncbi:hypothetical protein [Nonomuraea sp. NPDC049784]|uniref:hypothetical protein n=1 Tax=Nonomuraea sp. NPDC049784 TaxID=3154361 RepID=UPI0033EC09F3